MRSSILLGALCAISAMASPIDKRAYTTEIIVITLTETVTPGETPTPAPTADVDPVEKKYPVSYTTVLTTSTPLPTSTSAAATPSETPSETPAPAPQPSSSQEAPAPSPSAANSYQAAVLQNHNIHRANHSANALGWSSDLEKSAAALANGCVYEHNTDIDGGGYGQNIGYGIDADNIGALITDLMYNDEVDYFEDLYGQANPDMSHFDNWGHFSQIVWKGTTEVGCATVVCNSLGNVQSSDPVPFTVCNYSPPGNYAGEYADNVEKPQGHAVYSVPQ